MPKFFRFPWASTGDKTAIPDETDVAGFVSYQQGYGNDYARDPASDPLAKLIERDKMNQLYSDLTENVQYWQTHAFPEYITAAQNGGVDYAYDELAIVRYDSGTGYKVYQNTVAGNTNLPTGAGWVEYKIEATINAAAAKTTPVDADELALVDSAASNALKKLTWANLKANVRDGLNLITNSNGLVNQRGYVSGTATTAANQYTIDMFRVVTSGQNLTFTTTAGVTTFTAPAGGVDLPIENKNIIGGSYVLSFTGTATAVVAQSVDNVTYADVTPVSGVYTITGGYYVRVRFSSGTFGKPKFEEGTIPTPYSLKKISAELDDCQRYLPSFNSTGTVSYLGGGAATTATSGYGFIHFKVEPRVTPTGMVLSSPTHINYSGLSAGTASDVFVSSYSLEGVSIQLTLSAQTAGSGVIFFNTPSAYMYLTGCEL